MSTEHARARRLAMPLPILSLEEAARMLPLRETDARAWLVREGLVRSVAGRQVVSWAAVLDRLSAEEAMGPREVPRAVPDLPRSTIPERRRPRKAS